ncbi:hypothetical protein CAT723_04960 [Corynebacterium ammoniagenes]|uniref:DUF218 domain-containing protein n=1 Tax=Corynebacterium ammoniagenes TaxID=1697 RepID=A0AAV5G4H5_CORAM|nr:hypothetical protein CAT723_04960 [Corynebacterium ammoniagenes]
MRFRRRLRACQLATRWVRRLIAFVTPIAVLLGVPAWFLFPPQDDPVSSDVIFVLAGAYDGRHELGAQMVAQGVSQHFVVSNSSGSKDKVGSEHCRGDSRPQSAEDVWCLQADPLTTTGEAVALDELAKKEGWASVTAVTNRPHTRRVRTNLEQCTDLNVEVVPIDEIDILRAPTQVAREIGGYIKFLITNPC